MAHQRPALTLAPTDSFFRYAANCIHKTVSVDDAISTIREVTISDPMVNGYMWEEYTIAHLREEEEEDNECCNTYVTDVILFVTSTNHEESDTEDEDEGMNEGMNPHDGRISSVLEIRFGFDSQCPRYYKVCQIYADERNSFLARLADCVNTHPQPPSITSRSQ